MDDPDRLRALLQQKDDEVQQLRLNLQRSEGQARRMEEEAYTLEEEVTDLRKQLNNRNRNSSDEASLMELRGINSDLETKLAETESYAEELRDSLKKKEHELESERKNIPQVEESFNTSNNNTAELEERIRILQEEVHSSVSEKMELETMCLALRRKVEESEETTNDLISETNALRRSLNDARDHIDILESNVDGMRHNTHYAAQGNSMFKEFVDEREPLEKELKKLFGENLELRHTNTELQRKLDEAILLQGPSTATVSVGPCTCAGRSEEIKKARAAQDSAERKLDMQLTVNADLVSKQISDHYLRSQVLTYKSSMEKSQEELRKLRPQLNEARDQFISANAAVESWKERTKVAEEAVEWWKGRFSSYINDKQGPPAVPFVEEKITMDPPQETSFMSNADVSAIRHSSLITPARTTSWNEKEEELDRVSMLKALTTQKREIEAERSRRESEERSMASISTTNTTRRTLRAKMEQKKREEEEKRRKEKERSGKSAQCVFFAKDGTMSMIPPKKTVRSNNDSFMEPMAKKDRKDEEDVETENTDPSILMAKGRMEGDMNLEETALAEGDTLTPFQS